MRILVPTDFSTYADSALNVAKLIAKKYNADIDLFHSVDSILAWSKENLSDIRNSYLLKVGERLDDLVDRLRAEGIGANQYTGTGTLIEDLTHQLEAYTYDLIIMGSHGARSKEEWFIGTNAQKVVRKLHTNVLVIKNDFDKIDFSEVLFVTGLNQEDQKALEYFLDFIRPFDVKKVHILAVNTEGYFSQPSIIMLEALKDFETIANKYDTETHFYSDYSVDAGVRHFSSENSIDLIAMSNHSRRPIKRLLQGSNVEIVVNHSELPVLTIDYKH